MSTFHHIGIFVKDLNFGKKILSKIFNVVSASEEIIDENIGVKIIFLKDNKGILYELVAPYGDKSPVLGTLKRGKDFLNHIAYLTNSFEKEVNKLRGEGFVPLGEAQSAKAFSGAKVIFLLSPLGFIVELIEDKH
jgi:methylmalonyl-CoA/ethylmalonyl-CoA epimerase